MTASKPKRNPPHQQDQTGGSNGTGNHPLYGFVPRRVTAKQVEAVLVSDPPSRQILGRYLRRSAERSQDGKINPFNKQPYSAQYKKVLETRKKLPAYAQMAEFYDMASNASAGSSEVSGTDDDP